MQAALVEAFATSPEWSETTKRFDRLSKHVTKLTESEVERIIEAYRENNQLFTAIYLTNKDRLKKFLNSVSDDDFTIEGKVISRNDVIPF